MKNIDFNRLQYRRNEKLKKRSPQNSGTRVGKDPSANPPFGVFDPGGGSPSIRDLGSDIYKQSCARNGKPGSLVAWFEPRL